MRHILCRPPAIKCRCLLVLLRSLLPLHPLGADRSLIRRSRRGTASYASSGSVHGLLCDGTVLLVEEILPDWKRLGSCSSVITALAELPSTPWLATAMSVWAEAARNRRGTKRTGNAQRALQIFPIHGTNILCGRKIQNATGARNSDPTMYAYGLTPNRGR